METSRRHFASAVGPQQSICLRRFAQRLGFAFRSLRLTWSARRVGRLLENDGANGATVGHENRLLGWRFSRAKRAKNHGHRVFRGNRYEFRVRVGFGGGDQWTSDIF